MKVLAVLAVAVAAWSVSLAVASSPETHVASCEPGPVMIGSGKASWRRESAVAGPLGIRRRPLSEMSPYSRHKPNVLVTKAPILVEGSDPVTLSVPPALAHRVFLYYGFHTGPDGRRSTGFSGYPGDSAIEFQPCTDKPRTVWPGGLRVKGRDAVHLDVTVAGRPEPIALPLGRPAVYDGR
jgi:hypothetical protein